MLRIGIFLNVFDVHVNRMPMAGRVAKLVYTRRQVPQREPRQGERR